MPSGKKDKGLKKKYSSFFSNRRDIYIKTRTRAREQGERDIPIAERVQEVPLQDREGNPRD